MAIYPVSSVVFCSYKEDVDPSDVVSQIRHIATVGTRAPVFAMRLLGKMEVEADKRYRSRRLQEGLHRGVC